MIVFSGSIDPETNLNWCSDCRGASEYIKKSYPRLLNDYGIDGFKFRVGLRPE